MKQKRKNKEGGFDIPRFDPIQFVLDKISLIDAIIVQIDSTHRDMKIDFLAVILFCIVLIIRRDNMI